MALLEIENLQTHFRTPDGVNRAVDGVSFHIDEGETLAIVGESGCGKSVTALSILRLIPEPPGKIAGAIRLQGRDLLALDDAECSQDFGTGREWGHFQIPFQKIMLRAGRAHRAARRPED